MFPNRIGRVAETMRSTLSEIIQDSLKDPGFPAVFTITRVVVSRDLHHARVHFSQLPDDEAAVATTRKALERARGFLRRELGQRMPIKYLPELDFAFDPSEQHAQRIESLLHKIRRDSTVSEDNLGQDAQGAAQKSDAQEDHS